MVDFFRLRAENCRVAVVALPFELLGYADLKTTQRYPNVTDEELRKTMPQNTAGHIESRNVT